VRSSDHPCQPSFPRTRRRVTLTFGVGVLTLLAVVVPACSSGNKRATTTPSTASVTSSSASATGNGSSSDASAASTIDPCSVVTDAVAAKVYGAGSTVTATPSNPSGTSTVCSVSVKGLSYDLNVTVGSVSEYQTQKAVAFKNPTDFPGLGNEAVIGKSSDDTGAQPGLLYRTDSGMVYISGESDQAKLTALAGALAAQG